MVGASEAEKRKLWGTEVSMIFQDPMTSLNPVTKIGKQIDETLRVRLGMSKEDAKARAIELLELVGIPSPAHRYDAYPGQLSGGMRQRVVIAIALACSPQLVLADENCTGLPQRAAYRLRQDHVLVLEELEGLCVVLNGNVLAFGTIAPDIVSLKLAQDVFADDSITGFLVENFFGGVYESDTDLGGFY